MKRAPRLWRVNIKTDSVGWVNPFEFSRKNNILGFGWCLKNKDGNLITPKDIGDCEKLGREQYK